MRVDVMRSLICGLLVILALGGCS